MKFSPSLQREVACYTLCMGDECPRNQTKKTISRVNVNENALLYYFFFPSRKQEKLRCACDLFPCFLSPLFLPPRGAERALVVVRKGQKERKKEKKKKRKLLCSPPR
eukprot:TRINITY_DN2607_c2_g1_i2.p1 TRINITY_DN2607_c2_g1~~TRINITY_DN2607_c2_g1_i2.p1  ORF type:complete len:107 (+),score=12.96 TRINITY_DN2607_c2_g1_i2:917-1237(+)